MSAQLSCFYPFYIVVIFNGERESEMSDCSRVAPNLPTMARKCCETRIRNVSELFICVPERFIHFFPRVHLLFFKGNVWIELENLKARI